MKAFYENRTYDPEVPVIAFRSKNLSFVAHWHSDIEMIYVCEGSIGVGINSEYRVLHAGGVSICGSNDIHYYVSEGMKSAIIIIIFRPEVLESFKIWPSGLKPCSLFIDAAGGNCPDDLSAGAGKLFAGIEKEIKGKNGFYPHFAQLGIAEFFALVFRHLPSYYTECVNSAGSGGLRSGAGIRPMQKAIKYLEQNYAQVITLEQISGAVNLSRFYFSRLFSKTTGMNFNAYLNRLRIDKAEELIKNTRKPIIEIAYETGFSSVRTFNRSFRAIKGRTPQSLRKDQVHS